MGTYNPAHSWAAMSNEDRLSAIVERADRSLPKIGEEFGVSKNVLSKFIRAQGTTYPQLRSEQAKRKRDAEANLIAPLWKKRLSTAEISALTGISSARIDSVTVAARKSGDDRFPAREGGGRQPKNSPAKSSDGKSLRSVGVAFLRERHPNGKKYTPACIFKAHREFPPGFKFRKDNCGFSQRELTSLTQLMQASA